MQPERRFFAEKMARQITLKTQAFHPTCNRQSRKRGEKTRWRWPGRTCFGIYWYVRCGLRIITIPLGGVISLYQMYVFATRSELNGYFWYDRLSLTHVIVPVSAFWFEVASMAGYQYSSQNMRKPTRSSNRDATGVQEQRAPMLLPNDSILLLLFGAPVILLPPDTRSGSQRA